MNFRYVMCLGFCFSYAIGMDTHKKDSYVDAMLEVRTIAQGVYGRAAQLWNCIADPYRDPLSEEKKKIYDAKSEMIDELSKAQSLLAKYKKRSIDPLYEEAQEEYKKAINMLAKLNLSTSC